MKILGINNSSHDSSAAIVIDGKIIAASEEERFDRIKHSGNFPINAIKFCLKKSFLKMDDIDEVCISMDWLKRAKSRFDNLFSIENASLCIEAIKQAQEDVEKRIDAEKSIRRELNYKGKISFLDHHDCHASACYFPSKFSDAAIITVDGAGEYAATRIYKASGNKLKRVFQTNFPNSLGALYSLTTAFLDFKIDSDEGKVMGLAPYGDKSLVRKFGKLIRIEKSGNYKIKDRWFDFPRESFSVEFKKIINMQKRNGNELSNEHKNLAFATQTKLEDALLGLAKLAKEITESKKLCLGGGVALNSVANGKIIKAGLFKDVFIYPASGDSGTAVGAALLSYNNQTTKKIFYRENLNPYLGYNSTNSEIIQVLKSSGLKYKKSNNIEKEAAELLANNKIVGWFSGRTEFGPRALGNRSILVDPRDATNKDRVNLKIKFRESFRPFAPVVLEEFADEYFDMNGNRSPYMILAFDVREGKSKVIPAVTHVDNTARVQTINKLQNKKYWNLINEFFKITGVPVLLNTSFNRAGEVMVNTPKEAINTFLGSDLDALVLENYLVLKG